MTTKTSDAEKKAKAKFDGAMAALKPLLLAALDAAHKCVALRQFDDGERGFERTVELGEIMMALSVINHLVELAIAIHADESSIGFNKKHGSRLLDVKGRSGCTMTKAIKEICNAN